MGFKIITKKRKGDFWIWITFSVLFEIQSKSHVQDHWPFPERNSSILYIKDARQHGDSIATNIFKVKADCEDNNSMVSRYKSWFIIFICLNYDVSKTSHSLCIWKYQMVSKHRKKLIFPILLDAEIHSSCLFHCLCVRWW